MLPYKTILELNTESRTPKYLQISNQFIKHITNGVIPPGTKLAGARQLSEDLNVNRRTIIAAFDELAAQGWISIHPNKGCFVKEKLPHIKPKTLASSASIREMEKTWFPLNVSTDFEIKVETDHFQITINDGYPDTRLAPLKELGKNYSYILNSSLSNSLMTYNQSPYGDRALREELIKYVRETRSIQVTTENILITRGSLMAFYILFKSILSPKNDQVIVGFPGYNEAHESIKLAGGKLNFVSVDEMGMNIAQVEALCKKKRIRAVFIIPHHHYPTTVSLTAARRMELLQLAEKYRFAVIEDDYDYDYHYSSAPILPMASIDHHGSVAYVGSFSKTVAPSLRLGFIVAPKELIFAASRVSRFVDSFGNVAMERAVAMLFKDGQIRRHLRKSQKVYRERCEHFSRLLESELSDFLSFRKPEGGMAFWTQLKNTSLQELILAGKQLQLKIPDELGFSSQRFETNCLRIGFASMNEKEAEILVEKLKAAFERINA